MVALMAAPKQILIGQSKNERTLLDAHLGAYADSV